MGSNPLSPFLLSFWQNTALNEFILDYWRKTCFDKVRIRTKERKRKERLLLRSIEEAYSPATTAILLLSSLDMLLLSHTSLGTKLLSYDLGRTRLGDIAVCFELIVFQRRARCQVCCFTHSFCKWDVVVTSHINYFHTKDTLYFHHWLLLSSFL